MKRCKRGHEMTPDNIYTYKTTERNGQRATRKACKTCKKQQARKWHEQARQRQREKSSRPPPKTVTPRTNIATIDLCSEMERLERELFMARGWEKPAIAEQIAELSKKN